jgi:hypothetical protein
MGTQKTSKGNARDQTSLTQEKKCFGCINRLAKAKGVKKSMILLGHMYLPQPSPCPVSNTCWHGGQQFSLGK